MRGLKSTLALLVVLLGLGGYIYFGLANKPDSSTTSQEKLFPALEAAKIDEIKVKSESGDVTSLKKEGDAWKITAPIQANAADSDVTALNNGISALEVVRVIDENPTDLKQYGLDAPRFDVEYKSTEGKSSGHVLFGAKAAAGGNLYARREDQKRVVLVASYHESSLNKSTFDLRDKSIVKVDREKVDGIDVTADGKGFELAKADADWKLIKPIAARADYSAADGLIGHIEGLQMKSVASASPSPADLKTYGLDKPQAVVNLHLGSARATIEVGGKAVDGATYVRDTSKPDVYTVETTAVDDLKKPADDYRKKELFDFRAFSATHVEITKDGQTVVLERVKAKDQNSPDTWHRVSPNPGDPDRSKVENLLAGLADIRATSFVDKSARTGLQTPALVVAAKFDEGRKEERVTFGKNGSDAYASRPDDPSVSKIEPTKLDDAIKALDEISK